MTTVLPPSVAAILAGGLGTRLRPLIADVPKALADINDEPFLFLLLRKLALSGIKQVVLLTGYMHDQIETACGDGARFNLQITYSREQTPLGTAGALAHAEPLLKNERSFLLMNGDTYLNALLAGFMTQEMGTGIKAVMGVLPSQECERFGSVQMNPETGLIEAFREKQAVSTGFINAGIYKLTPEIFKELPKQTPCSLEKDVFPALLIKQALRAYVLDGKLDDIGTPESYLAFNKERKQA